MHLRRPLGWLLGVALLWTLCHNGVLMVLGTGGPIRYAREALLIVLTLVSLLLAFRGFLVVARLEALVMGFVFVMIGTCTTLLFLPNDILTWSERLKGWYGFCSPLGLAVLIILLRTNRLHIERLLSVILGVGLFFAIGILADSLFGLRLSMDVFEDKGSKFAQGAYRASFIIDSPMGAGYLTASTVLLAVFALGRRAGTWRLRLLALVTLLAGIAANLACLSRGGTVILIASLALTWLLGGFFRANHFIVIVVAVTALLFFFHYNTNARGWLALTFNFEDESSNLSREQAWLDGLEAARDGGWTGYGLGITRDLEVRSGLRLNNGENTLLHGWQEGGIPLVACLAAWLCLWLFIIIKGTIHVLHNRDPFLAALCAINVLTWVYSFLFPILVDRTVSVLALGWFALLVRAVATSASPIRVSNPQTIDLVPCES